MKLTTMKNHTQDEIFIILTLDVNFYVDSTIMERAKWNSGCHRGVLTEDFLSRLKIICVEDETTHYTMSMNNSVKTKAKFSVVCAV